ncbi:MAG: hypothetical protein AB2L24_26220 [Mangrovibacterium sp.]
MNREQTRLYARLIETTLAAPVLSVLIIMGIVLLPGCAGKNTGSQTTAEVVQPVQQAKKPYPIEKGIVYQTTRMAGMDEITERIYFDQWGKRKCTEQKSEMVVMGTKIPIHKLRIEKDGEIWDIDVEEKKGTHYRMPGMISALGIDVNSITEEIKEDMKIKSMEKVTFLGYPCQKIIMGDNLIEYIVYGNLLMYSKGEMSGMDLFIEVTKIEETDPPADIFSVPEGIQITEMVK